MMVTTTKDPPSQAKNSMIACVLTVWSVDVRVCTGSRGSGSAQCIRSATSATEDFQTAEIRTGKHWRPPPSGSGIGYRLVLLMMMMMMMGMQSPVPMRRAMRFASGNSWQRLRLFLDAAAFYIPPLSNAKTA